MKRGFTLIEIMIATALFAGLMGMYGVVFLNVVQLEDYARSQRSFSSVAPAILDLVEDDLLSFHADPRAKEVFPFRGADESLSSEPADRMNFVARRASIHQEEFYGDGQWLRSPINEVGYRMVKGDPNLGDVRKLFRRESYYLDQTPLQGGDFFEVYDRVIAFSLEYVGYQEEEDTRTDAGTRDERQYEKFESWDSEERKFFPSAVVITLTIEPPQLTFRDRESREEPDRRTFVRVVRLIQSSDVLPPEGETVQADPNAQTPGTTPDPGTTPAGDGR